MIIICEACKKRDNCPLEKRKQNAYLAPCPKYIQGRDTLPLADVEKIAGRAVLWLWRIRPTAGRTAGIPKGTLPPDSFTLDEVRAIIAEVMRPAPVQRVVSINIQTEFTEKSIFGGVFNVPRDLHLDFLETNLDDSEEAGTFLDREEVALFCCGMRNNEYADTLMRDLKAVQKDLGEMAERWAKSRADFGVERIPLSLEGQDIVAEVYRKNIFLLTWLIGDTHPRKCTDIDRLNTWIKATLQFSVERNTKTGVIEPYAGVSAKYWPGILYFLFAQNVIKGQKYKLCPAKRKGCKGFVRSVSRGQKPKTCRNNACQQWVSRRLKQRKRSAKK